MGDGERCGTCRFWMLRGDLARTDGMLRGHCRHESPRMFDPDDRTARWPISDAGEWCGDYHPRVPLPPAPG